MASNSGGYPDNGDTGNLVTEQVRQGTQQVVQGTQDAISQVKEQATQQAQTVFERQKSQARTQLDSVSQALRQTGDSLRQQNQGAVAGILDGAAGEVESWNGYLENRDFSGLVSDLENVARRNSTLFLAGAFALGLVGARFLKSSSQKSGSTGGYSGGYNSAYGGYGTGNYAYGGSTGYGSSYGSGTRLDDTSGYGSSSSSYGTGSLGYTEGSISDYAGTTGLSESGAITSDSLLEDGDVQTDRPY
jgi:ElaB/YqjD/DUF883 family membrane-anchored ribosome-binding protein